MNGDTFMAYLGFFSFSALLMLAPFYPAWKEWRYPSDQNARPLPSHRQAETAFGQEVTAPSVQTPPLWLRPDTVASGTTRSPHAIVAPSGACFETLVAPAIYWGASSKPSADENPIVAQTSLLTLAHATRWGRHGWRVDGDCHITATHHLRGALVVTGRLRIDEDCTIEGDIKARRGLDIGARTHIAGALFCDQDIHLGAQVRVKGPVMSEGWLDMASGVVVGDVDAPTTLSADVLTVHIGARSHGTVHARSTGVVL